MSGDVLPPPHDTNTSLASPKGTLANIADPDQTLQDVVSNQSTLFALTTGISIKHGKSKNYCMCFLSESRCLLDALDAKEVNLQTFVMI